MLGETLRWTSISTKGEQKYSYSFHARETGINSGLISHLAHMQTFIFLFSWSSEAVSAILWPVESIISLSDRKSLKPGVLGPFRTLIWKEMRPLFRCPSRGNEAVAFPELSEIYQEMQNLSRQLKRCQFYRRRFQLCPLHIDEISCCKMGRRTFAYVYVSLS